MYKAFISASRDWRHGYVFLPCGKLRYQEISNGYYTTYSISCSFVRSSRSQRLGEALVRYRMIPTKYDEALSFHTMRATWM